MLASSLSSTYPALASQTMSARYEEIPRRIHSVLFVRASTDNQYTLNEHDISKHQRTLFQRDTGGEPIIWDQPTTSYAGYLADTIRRNSEKAQPDEIGICYFYFNKFYCNELEGGIRLATNKIKAVDFTRLRRLGASILVRTRTFAFFRGTQYLVFSQC